MPSDMTLHHNSNDLTGQIFGKLSVLSVSGRTAGRSLVWACKCECGKTVNRSSDTLRQGKSKSCGCYKQSHEFRVKVGLAQRKLGTAIRKEFNHTKSGAIQRNHNFELSFEQFLQLTSKNCHYCGAIPAKVTTSKWEQFISNGLDRVDNAIGYVLSNVVPCCTICNYMKRALSVTEFLQHIERISSHQYRNNLAVS